MYLWGPEGIRSLSGCFHLDRSKVLDQKRWRNLQYGASESW